MYKKKLDELEKQLSKLHPEEIKDYIKQNDGEILSEGRYFMKYMTEKIKEKNLLKQDILLKADISLGYGYKLLSEEKVTKQRDVILRICYAAEFTVSEVQHALQLYHMEMLYPRNPRDALLMVCFNERPGSVIDVNDLLVKNDMKPLRSCGVQK